MNKLCIVFVFLCFAAIASAQLNVTLNSTSPSFSSNATFNFTESHSVSFTTNATFNFTETPSVTFTSNATFNFSVSANQTVNLSLPASANSTANQTVNFSLPASPNASFSASANATLSATFSVNATFNFTESAQPTTLPSVSANATMTPSFSVNATFNFTESAQPSVNQSIVPPSQSPINSPTGTQEFSLSDTETASFSLSATVPAATSSAAVIQNISDSGSIPAPISRSNTANFPSNSRSVTLINVPGTCGNGIIEAGEQCEAKLTLSADGTKIVVNFKGTTCCNTDCQFVPAGQPCRKAPRTNSCLKKGVCDGAGNCGALQPKSDGKRCIRGRNKRGVCSNGVCVRI